MHPMQKTMQAKSALTRAALLLSLAALLAGCGSEAKVSQETYGQSR